MIEIVMTGMCEGCPHADIEIIKLCTVTGEKIWDVVCKHEAACKAMKKRFEKKEETE